MFKKLLFALIAIVGLTLLITGCRNDEKIDLKRDVNISNIENKESKELDFEFDKANGIIEKYIGSGENAVIPSDIKGVAVTSIGENAFANCTSLTSVIIPVGVTDIRPEAFAGCINLKNITIPNSITTIWEGAFGGCTSLENLNIPNGVASIRSGAFAHCTSLTSITIPDSVIEIGDCTFNGCKNLKEIIIPESVEGIGIGSFLGCTKLTMHGEKGSYAENYANENNIVFSNKNKTVNTIEITADALSMNVADYFNNYCKNQGLYLYKDFNKNQYKMILYYNKKGINFYSYPVISVKQDASSTNIYIKHINAKTDSECKNEAYFSIITQMKPMEIKVYEDENIVNYTTSDDIVVINKQ